ncbi:CGNR zinc finger domain-containing protein [Rhodococcus triatomae]|uniref:Putative stress-induced transcription regulator n=1 Tax=Rhodococcus triatomae TaxID=300028 RepID=A0A1G8KYG8_9NOCA|nr:CGNR zinc finger domain-containing protein [Rhodococcus triatomae]QNG20462.1 CGNR zinc finger domain-containing protein [Rhodococcus triatomae]QNG23621.1 CGNR zinc finger domain-containing protein [Rhodococcus triatomae]SDI48474.1 Putative stress-induced transcription regulator [Rhodococcus triatomae]
MHLNPYGEYAVVLAADLVNTPPQSIDELVDRCVDAGIVVDFPVEYDDLDAVHEVLRRWLAVVDATTERHRADLVNEMLASASAYPRLTDHAGDGWHLHYRDDQHSLAGVLAALFSVGTALHLVGRGMYRLGRCTADDCDRVYADVSRNGTQRYCSPRCANRDAVRRHRSRHR